MLGTDVVDHGSPVLHDPLAGGAKILVASFSMDVPEVPGDASLVDHVLPAELAEVAGLAGYEVLLPV